MQCGPNRVSSGSSGVCEQAVASTGMPSRAGEVGQPREVVDDPLGPGHEERPGRLQKVALGVDVDENERAWEHERRPRGVSGRSDSTPSS